MTLTLPSPKGRGEYGSIINHGIALELLDLWI